MLVVCPRDICNLLPSMLWWKIGVVGSASAEPTHNNLGESRYSERIPESAMTQRASPLFVQIHKIQAEMLKSRI